ncbi:MAG TPA: carboxypeptidase-like regulatory domain-containing protein [Pyrinomonadaceae bacterium]|nr:carboxypeptidase-like regulatory domain-containing protein [Pyrinomonadaceae bacterium]
MKEQRRKIRSISALIVMLPVILASVVSANPNVAENGGGLAIIRGVVRDDGGSPIADATVAIFRAGTSTLLKQVQSATDGSYLARIAPGTYTVLAVAQGFNPVTYSEVEVLQSAQLTYGFKLERAGSGNTLPEKRLDRNNPKWVRRSATLSRSIYQNVEGEEPATADVAQADEKYSSDRKGQTVAETYFAGNDEGNFVGLNFATFLPVNEDVELILAAQTGAGSNAPQRFEVQSKFRPAANHQIRVNTSFGKLGAINSTNETLGQLSVQATDELNVREGIIFVFGFDYAKFVGAGSDSSISPRIGFQYDFDSKTRLRTSFTTQTEQRNWSRTIELEDAQVIFREPVAVEDFVVEGGKPLMNKSRRFEIGIERVLDNNSSIDANLFFDATFARGVGFAAMPFSGSGAFTLDEFVGNQHGDAQGFSLVYNRRLSSRISTSAGYSLGRGQRLSGNAVSNPAELFENSFFQSFFGQVDADFKTGTNVKTIFRLSPEATVFAIDPFQGRLAIYDPSMSVLVTQDLPTLGLPIHAQAVVDARNIFDFHPGINGEDGSLRINGQGRTLRGGILVRF